MPGGPVRDVIIVGGGIAGIAAALRLARRGVSVRILETRKKLGGRATSFRDARTGLVIDNCQHVAMGCCTNYLRLLRDLGVAHLLEWHSDIHWIEEGGRRSTLRPGALPAPAHLSGSFLTASFLSRAEKLAIARGMRAILRADRQRHSSETFGQWLTRSRQPESALRRFWSPIVISACNCEIDTVCAQTALHVFQEGFLLSRQAGVVGMPRVPLVELYDPAEEAIAAAGGEIRLGASVRTLGPRSVELASGEVVEADAVIVAVPPERAVRIVAPEIVASDPRFAMLEQMTHSPILGVHLVFDRPVLDTHSAVLVDRGTQWLFSKPGDPVGSHIHAVISAADDWMDLSEQEISQRVLADINACLPESRSASVESVRAVKERLATFAPTPETEAARPGTVGPEGRKGVILAGDYVRTGWPATMEGAARSGFMAAAAVLEEDPAGALEPSLKPSPIVRTIAGPLARAARSASIV